jgi:hypothetical protein
LDFYVGEQELRQLEGMSLLKLKGIKGKGEIPKGPGKR